MSREVRLYCLVLCGALMVVSVACQRKPAYSEIDANRAVRTQNQNSGAQQATTPPTAAEAPPASASQPASPARPAPVKIPSFVDPIKNEVRDLPNYPRATRVNVQIGPVQGLNVMTLALKTFDPMDKITAFYEQEIKKNKWTVTDKSIDRDVSSWNLKKGDDNEAKVQIKKDPQSTLLNIIIVRGEKLAEPDK